MRPGEGGERENGRKELDENRRRVEDDSGPLPVPGLPIPKPRFYMYQQRREVYEDRGRGNKRAEPEAEKPSEAEEGRIE